MKTLKDLKGNQMNKTSVFNGSVISVCAVSDGVRELINKGWIKNKMNKKEKI